MDRLPRILLAACLGTLLFTVSGRTLERTTARLAELREAESWARGGVSTIRYYNNCTGWIWLWSGWKPRERIGTVFQVGSGVGSLVASWSLAYSAPPSGYGYTGTITAHDVDLSGCPVEPPIAQQPWLPPQGNPWLLTYWGYIPPPSSQVAVLVTMANATGNPIRFASDHPAAGPTGPIACGTCYPTTRTPRSFYWGTTTSALCPGNPFFDGFCDAELMLDLAVTGPPTALESASWGRIKVLYR